MALAKGTQLGPYEIVAPLGAGGMGEVYRARDDRLSREVAIKVLPPAYSADPERLRRFEQEARAAGMLNHPNILAIYDIGSHQGSPYVVSELLEGETLRERLGGTALGAKKAIEYARQVAAGLAAAHQKGIVHRDLKPENIFITEDGRVKILDFGLAKLVRPESSGSAETNAPTVAVETDPGAVLGTAGYMSPEQVRGRPTDHRSDIFSFGAILYEMLAGRRAFRGESAVETMHAILKEEPREFTATTQKIPPGLERIVRHCLEKGPEERFQSARDLAFDLEALSEVSVSAQALAPVKASPGKRRYARVAIELALVAAAVGAYFWGRGGERSIPSFHQLTFRRGSIQAARFAPDGRTIYYGAAWDGGPIELYATRPESPESRLAGFPAAGILAISPSGEAAISLGCRFPATFGTTGTLARAPLSGGAPREVLENVSGADWSPDGSELAAVHVAGLKQKLEWPVGTVVYESAGWIGEPRISPRRDRLAFVEHSTRGDDGEVAVVDRAGKKTVLSPGWTSVQGLAWSPRGNEIWFTGTKAGGARALQAVTPAGRERMVARVAGALTLQDISRDGRVLLTHETARMAIQGLAPGESKERDLSWLDWSLVRDLSDDGKILLFDETGEASGGNYGVYIRMTDGSPAVRLGDGTALALSRDGRMALSISRRGATPQLVVLPTRAGAPKRIERGPVTGYMRADFHPDGKRIIFIGTEPGHGPRCYVQEIDAANPRAITPEVAPGFLVSPDGAWVGAAPFNQPPQLYPVDGGAPKRFDSPLGDRQIPVGWSADGRWLYSRQFGELPLRIFRMELSTGRRELWKQLSPPDLAGVRTIGGISIAPGADSYAYSYARILADVYLVDGLR